jgi:hypothetical protein
MIKLSLVNKGIKLRARAPALARQRTFGVLAR